jgi:heat-inducible transcriptional repressor
MEPDLDRRNREVLRAVIRNFIETGEPVGSRTIAKLYEERLSAATIRNIMADLEEAGFLMQPHTSAGRVPTDRGYRYYVDSLLSEAEIPRSDREKVAEVFSQPRNLSDAMEEISRLLSRLTRQVGFVVASHEKAAALRHIEFVSLGPGRVLAVLVDQTGVLHHRLADNPEDLPQEELDRIGRYLTEEFQGRNLPEIRSALLERMRQEKDAFDSLLQRAIALGEQVLREPETASQVYVQGTPNILQQHDLGEEEMRRLFETFEAKGRMVQILDEVMASDDLKVIIGSEHPDPALAHVSLVASPYKIGDRRGGALGILGPTRMEYARAIALVDYISKVLSRILTGPPA